MPRPSRPALWVALLAVPAAPAARAAEPDKLIPARADAVITVNLKGVFGSDLAEKSAAELEQQLHRQDTRKLAAALGIDPLKDVETFVVCYLDTTFGDGAEPDFLLVLRGAFDAEKTFKAADAAARADAARFALVKDGGTVFFKYTASPKRPPMYAIVIDGKAVAVASDRKLVADALKAADANKPAPVKKELADLLKKADDKAVVHAAFLLKGKFADGTLANRPLKLAGLTIGGPKGPLKVEKLDQALPGAESAVLAVRVTTDATFELTVGMKDEAAANDMRNATADLFEQLKPIAGVAALLDPQARPLPGLVAAVKVGSKGKDVTVSLKIPEDDLRTILRAPQKSPPKKN